MTAHGTDTVWQEREIGVADDATEACAIEMALALPPARVVALFRQVMKSRTDFTDLHLQSIAAAAGQAESDLARQHWPVREGNND